MKKRFLSLTICMMTFAIIHAQQPQSSSMEQSEGIKAASSDKTESEIQQSTDNEVLQVVDEMPEYPGGIGSLMKYLSENIKYPPRALQEGREGRVIIQFVINRDGSVVEAKVRNSVYSDLDEEALRVVNSMPKWKPGKHKGKFVRVKFNLPITFKIPKKEEK